MTFTTKDWKDDPDPTTPISAVALEDMETRLAAYTDAQNAAGHGSYGLIVAWRSIIIPAATGASTLVLPGASAAGLPAATTDSPLGLVYLDPADFSLSGFTTKYRLRAVLATNATAPAMNFTAGLYPVSAVAGGAGAITETLGTVVTGSTVLFTAQALSTLGQGNSGDFTAPAAGWYALAVVLSGSVAANARVALSACLQKRNV